MGSRLRRLCGQLLTVGFEGTALPVDLRVRVAASEVGAVMLFRPNAEGPEQVAALVGALRRSAPADLPLVVAVDQEGGAVQRLRAPLTEWPDMLSVGSAGDPALTRAIGAALGAELAALGIQWDFAPVLDVHTSPENPVIGRRAFGRTPEAVAEHALAFWRGLRSQGVLGCGKHFPGHGDTTVDSHEALPRVPLDEARLRAVELAPFRAAAAAGLEALMTAHVVFPAFEPDLPATLSRRLLTGLLREEWRYRGLVASDDLGMKAVAERWPIEALVVEGLLAGVDVFLVREPRERQEAAFAALVRAAERRADVRARVEESAGRVARFKALAAVPMPLAGEALRARLGPPAHLALAASVPRAGPGPEAGSEVARV
jgi:beta-N-acetylhexosaminidase